MTDFSDLQTGPKLKVLEERFLQIHPSLRILILAYLVATWELTKKFTANIALSPTVTEAVEKLAEGMFD